MTDYVLGSDPADSDDCPAEAGTRDVDDGRGQHQPG